MNKILTPEQINEVATILNDMPIKELNRVQKIIQILNDAVFEQQEQTNQDEFNTEN